MQSSLPKLHAVMHQSQNPIKNQSQTFPSFHPSSQLSMHRMRFRRIENQSRWQAVKASTPHSPDPSLGEWLISTSISISHRSPVSICPSRTSFHPLLSSNLLLGLNRQSVVGSEGAVHRLVVVLSGLCDLLAELVEGTDVLLG